MHAVVRYTDFHPANHMEAYFYNVLLKQVPFRCEHELLSPANSDESYFTECQLRSLVTSQEDVEVHLHDYAARHMYEEVEQQRMLELMLQKNPRYDAEEPPLQL